MNPHFRAVTALVFGVFLLVACESRQPGVASPPVVVPSLSGLPTGLNEKCGGENGVKVRPCPVKLTSNSQKVTVEISGPGVVSGSYLGSCYDVCSIVLVRHGKPVKWRITPGTSCGKSGLLFQGINRHDILVGNADLTIINKSC